MEMRFKDLFMKYQQAKRLPDLDKFKERNPILWKKLTDQFEIGRQIVSVQCNNGLERLNEQTLRAYLQDYAKRFIKYGPTSFPTSFNALEPFFIYNHDNSVPLLVEEEESYGISLVDFLDFVTEANFDLNNLDYFEDIPEKIIYNFSFTSEFEEINFSNSKGKTFIISGLSLIRQGNVVSMLMQAGESYDKLEAEEYLKKNTRKMLEESLSPHKKSLGFEIDNEGETEVVHFHGRDDLWQHTVAMLFDLEAKSIDIRHVARDENISYYVVTDDFNSVFSRSDTLGAEERNKIVTNLLNELSKYDAVFDFAKYCLALPYYVSMNEEGLVEVTYQTLLHKLMTGPLSRKQFAKVPCKYKLYAKSFYYLESKTNSVVESSELNDNSFKIEKSGYWKRIGIDEKGFDKKGRKIIGKTWVERNDIYYTNPIGVTTVNEVKKFDTQNAGYVYVMRQPAFENDIFKVGLTRRSIEERRSELSNTSTPDHFFVINSYYTKDCKEAEKGIHKALEMYRLSSRREFFRCDLRIILDACEKVVKNIND